MRIEVAMLTGDSQAVAKAVADQLGIQRVFAEVLPEHKDQKVMVLQKQGKGVARVGDGLNDAPALTRADVGITIGGGTDVAIESAGLILVNSNPLDVVKIFKLSRPVHRPNQAIKAPIPTLVQVTLSGRLRHPIHSLRNTGLGIQPLTSAPICASQSLHQTAEPLPFPAGMIQATVIW